MLSILSFHLIFLDSNFIWPQLSRIIYLFSSNMHDASLSLSIHTTCARLMLNLVRSYNLFFLTLFIPFNFLLSEWRVVALLQSSENLKLIIWFWCAMKCYVFCFVWYIIINTWEVEMELLSTKCLSYAHLGCEISSKCINTAS